MNRLFCILFCLCLLSCQQESDDKPANMVPAPKMVRILADIHTAEALIEHNVAYPDTALVIYSEKQAAILKKYDVDPKAFKDTYRYYLTHIDEMDQLYETVVDTLSVRESRAQAGQEAPEQKTDEPVPAPAN